MKRIAIIIGASMLVFGAILVVVLPTVTFDARPAKRFVIGLLVVGTLICLAAMWSGADAR